MERRGRSGRPETAVHHHQAVRVRIRNEAGHRLQAVELRFRRQQAFFPHVRLQGLDPEKAYLREDTGERLTGAALMQGGISLPQFQGDYPAVQIHLTVCG